MARSSTFQHHGQIQHFRDRLQMGLVRLQKFTGVKAAFQGVRHDGRFKNRLVLAAGGYLAIGRKKPLLVAHFHLGQFPEQVL
jgi:hypothetical protein